MSKNALTEVGSRTFGLSCQSGIHNFVRSKLERKIKLSTFSADIKKVFHLPFTFNYVQLQAVLFPNYPCKTQTLSLALFHI